VWLGNNVGSDIALANAIGREIIHAGLADMAFIERATEHFEAYRDLVEEYTLERAEELTGVPAEAIREVAHAYAKADRAMISWTLGITEHHTGVDNVLALISLALLTGHVGRYGSGLNPLRGQNNVQGGGDMGAIPNRLPGFQDIERNAEARAKFEAAYGVPIRDRYGWHLTQMFHGMETGELRYCYIIGENPAQSDADAHRIRGLLEGLDFLVVQDVFATKTAELADVILPGTLSWCETEGTVTNSERRVQRVRKALDPPGEARDDQWILSELARRLGFAWDYASSEEIWDELRSLSPMHAGMSYARLEAEDGIQWPCPADDHPGSPRLHERLWADEVEVRAPFVPVHDRPPVEATDSEYPIRLTTGRRLESYNTGVQTEKFTSPLHEGEFLELCPEDMERFDLEDGEIVRVSSRRGSVESPVRGDARLRPGLAFMTFHFPDQVDVNLLTIDAHDEKSGTAEFKACAVKVEKIRKGAKTAVAADERELVAGD
jgi:predicted molibdopterin-dependent oxidoreductase YjgC